MLGRKNSLLINNTFCVEGNMLILLQPGIQPLGQFDIFDSNIDGIAGGEVAAFETLTLTDGYAADVARPGPLVQLKLGFAGDPAVTNERLVWGLIDEGSSGGPDFVPPGPPTIYSGNKGYGTSYGKLIGGTVGQGTGFGLLGESGVVTIGPSTMRGSGKATLWTKPGLYGVTFDAFESDKVFDNAISGINVKLSGESGTGKLKDGITAGQVYVAYSLKGSKDTSLVSTPAYYANTGTTVWDHCVIYMVGCS
jgi:hypothetical protein